MRWILCFAAAVLGLSALGHEAAASEWGCEVLLCSASDNPSWHSIASCQPPMDRLISAMKKPGFSWPTCPEGGAGKPGYEKYADCPAGWSPAQDETNGNRIGGSELSRCSRIVNGCGRGRSSGGDTRSGTTNRITRIYSGDRSCSYTEFMVRPLRDKPYYFDIRDETVKTTSRYFFDLRK
jgi:hypothetical protein